MVKTTKHTFLIMLLILAFATRVGAQQRNVLHIPDVKVATGSAQLPVELDNSDEVVAVQFDLLLPAGVAAGKTAVPTSRLADHTVSVRNIGDNSYRILILSPLNKSLRGQQGVLAYLPLTIPETLEENSEHELTISDASVVRRTGEDVLTEATAGKLCVTRQPDLTVSNISVSKSSLQPGDRVDVAWQVTNVGDLPIEGSWSEQVSLVTADGTVNRLLTTIDDSRELAPDARGSRQIEVVLPALPGIDGTAYVQVRIVPSADCNEEPSARGNNTLRGTQSLTVGKLLVMRLSPSRLTENSSRGVEMTLSRSGCWNKDETFAVAASDARLTVPAEVRIPVGQSGVATRLQLSDNELLDADSLVTVTVEGAGYAAVQQQLIIEDNELPSLTLTTSKSVVGEGETFQLTIATDRLSSDELAIALVSEHPTRFVMPAQVVIPAGQQSVTVEVEAIDDDLPGLDLSSAITASAVNHHPGKTIVIVEDDDMPVLSLLLTPTVVGEGDGVTSVAATLRRNSHSDRRITVRLTDNAEGALFFPSRTVVMEKGVDEVSFNFGPLDNDRVDGNRTYDVTASVWISSCSCSAEGQSAGSVSASLQVLDDDGLALRLRTASTVLNEGSQTVLTVSRNTLADQELTLQLSSDADHRLSYSPSVTIPAGETQQTVIVRAVANDDEADSRPVVFTALADGFAQGTCWLMLSDTTMPDAQVLHVAVSESETVAGDSVLVTARVGNTGTASLPAQTVVAFHVDGSATPQLRAYLQEPLQPQSSVEIERKIALPHVVGTHRIQVAVNPDHKVAETSYANNVASPVSVSVLPPFAATVSTDKTVCAKGDTVHISGTISGRDVAGKTVEVYVVNEGYRHVVQATTDAQGRFSASYLPYDAQVGHFAVGACFQSERKTDEMASFEIPALRRASRGAITADFHLDETHTGTIVLTNPGHQALTGIQARALSVPYGTHLQVSSPSVLEGGSSLSLSYSISADVLTAGNDWQQAVVEVTSSEGASLSIPLYYYCRSHVGQLQSDISSIQTTINIDRARDYPFTIRNIGKGETGAITLALPSWMSTVTPATMPSLKQGESAQVVLRLSPSDRMQLNVPMTGYIGVNCASGNGFSLPYSIEPVSALTAQLLVDACDEYTYNTAEKPHLQNARVKVVHPATGAIVEQGVTSAEGLFRATLPEGYYKLKVTADHHDAYTENIIVSPGRDNAVTVNLSLKAITVGWSVVETEVDDEYRIENKVEFETNVPVPVVVVDAPQELHGDELQPGESMPFVVTLTNRGLVNAENTQLLLPANLEGWQLTPLSDVGPLTLAPDESISIALLLTRGSSASAVASRSKAPTVGEDCMAQISAFYQWYCGEDLKSNAALYRMALKSCASAQLLYTLGQAASQMLIDTGSSDGADPGTTIFEALGGENPGAPNGNSSSRYDFMEYDNLAGIGQGSFFCDPCRMAVAEAIANTVLGLIPITTPLALANSGLDAAINAQANGQTDPVDVAQVGLNAASMFSNAASRASIAVSVLSVLRVCLENNGEGSPDDDPSDDNPSDDNPSDDNPSDDNPSGGNPSDDDPSDNPPSDDDGSANDSSDDELPDPPSDTDIDNNPSYKSWGELRIFHRVAKRYYNQLRAADSLAREIFSKRIWFEGDFEELTRFFQAMKEQAADGFLSAESLMSHKPEAVGKDDVEALLERISQSREGSTAADTIHFDVVKEKCYRILAYEQEAQKEGYESLGAWFQEALSQLREDLSGSTSSVCSSISVSFAQTMVMTRQAFRGTLTVHNGHNSEPMTDIRLNLVITDEDGVVATEQTFLVRTESLNGFAQAGDLTGGWSLSAQSDGVATVLFVPSRNAAPTADRHYDFGGTLTYVDPFTGLEVTRRLSPVTLTVKPSPVLDLTYFMQRDVYGDDPLTPTKEPMVPAEFALLLHNKGYGDASNIVLTTAQPVIMRNEKNLKDSMSIVGSQLNGQAKMLALGKAAHDFGSLPAQHTSYAQWWIQNTLLGHFTSYDVSATHVSSHGNDQLSLIDQVTVHELVHGFTASAGGDTPVRGFLVNDIEDSEDLPDRIYFTDATQQDVGLASSMLIETVGPMQWRLTVGAATEGWSYGAVADPTQGRMRLVAVQLSDATALPVDCVWQTDRTLRDGRDWLYENRLHFVGYVPAEGLTLLLTFEPKPEEQLQVECFTGQPDVQTFSEEALTELTVRFSKPVKASTFTTDDVSLSCYGTSQDVSAMGIVQLNEREFRLLLGQLTASSGHYVLSVRASGIDDADGFSGTGSKQVAWLQRVGGTVTQSIAMEKGWNWVSTYMDEATALTGILPNVSRIVSQTEELVLDPQLGMTGRIASLLPGCAYKVKAARPFTATFQGHPFDADKCAASLLAGWNWMGCPFVDSRPVAVALQNAEEGDFILSQSGFAQYAYGDWAGSLTTMEPGQGYLYKSVSTKQLTFGSGSSVADSQARGSWTTAPTAGAIDIHQYPGTMNVIARLYHDGVEQSGHDYHIYAMAGDELRGIGQHVGQHIYLTIYGDLPVEITLIVESASTGSRYLANEVLLFQEGVVGSRKQPMTISFGTPTGIVQLEDTSRPMTIYTLDGIFVKRDATPGTLRRLPRGVYVVNGHKCYVR